MKTTTTTIKSVTLEMTESEATWLKDYLQNAPKGELTANHKMREQFFTAIKKALNPPEVA